MRIGLFLGVAQAALNIADEGGGAVIVIPPADDQAGAEAVAEAAVEVARIEGETAVALAQIEAAASLEHHELAVAGEAAFGEALAENINEGLEAERDQWKSRAEAAEAELLTRPALPPEPPPSLPPGAGEADLASLQVVEPDPPQSPPSPPEEPPKRARKPRWI